MHHSLLDYTKLTLFVFGNYDIKIRLPRYVKVISIYSNDCAEGLWTNSSQYKNLAILVRPDSYIESFASLDNFESLSEGTNLI